MKAKFINIPKEERKEVYMKARQVMLQWQANHNYSQSNFEQGNHFHKYTFDDKAMVIYWTEDKTIDFVYTEDEQKVIFKIHRQSWARDLFNKAIRGSKINAN